MEKNTILDKLAEASGMRAAADKAKISAKDMRRLAEERALTGSGAFAFEKALSGEDIGFICEVKKASPSKGMIAGEFPYLEIAKEYERAGADCISVLTEPQYFLGSDRYLTEIRRNVRIPLLRKDFTVDVYQIYQARTLGADCVLLIAALLGRERLKEYLKVCDSLGMSALTEAHNEAEIEQALDAGARMIGVNNRNLKDFTVDTGNSGRLRAMVPAGRLFIAESGIRTAAEIEMLRRAGADGVLIGEALMRSEDKKKALAGLKGVRDED